MRVGLLLDDVNKIEAEKVTQVAILLSSVVPRIGEVRVFEIYSIIGQCKFRHPPDLVHLLTPVKQWTTRKIVLQMAICVCIQK